MWMVNCYHGDMTTPGRKGILVAVEGIDGAGKTTQVELLVDALRRAGELVVASKEPTDGQWGRRIRESAHAGRLSLDDETDLFIKDRREHIDQVIQPALDEGKIVVLDRYFHSTLAYQGARGANVEDLLVTMRDFAPIPDIVILIDVAPEAGLERISESRGERPNLFEQLDQLNEVRRIFNQLAVSDSTIRTIDGRQGVAPVHRQIMELLLERVFDKPLQQDE